MTLTKIQTALLSRADADGRPLDPEQADDAAVLLRAEVLVQAGESGSQALAQARAELLAYCQTCEREKRVLRRHDLPGLAWPVCGHAPIHEERMNIDRFLDMKEGA